MTIVAGIFNGIHWLVALALLVGYAVSFQNGAINVLMVWAARVQLLLGLLIVGVYEVFDVKKLSHAKVGVKLLIALAVVALCEIAYSKLRKGENKPALMHAAAALVLINILVATLWKSIVG